MEFALSSSMVSSRMPIVPSPLPSRMKRWRSWRILSQFQSSQSTVLERTSSTETQPKYESGARIKKAVGDVEAQINKKKAVFILGATATGKTKLSIDLATQIEAEIINSDKIQVYKGLDIVTNKIGEDERKGIPHHLLGFMDPEADFTVEDFCKQVHMAMANIIQGNRIPIIVGGSNNYIKQLVENPSSNFRENFDTCFLWIDVALPVLYKRVAKRVDEMVEAGLVDEVRAMVVPGADYSRGVWRAIGVPEMDQFLYAEKELADELTKKMLLDAAIHRIKENTCRLVDSQLRKIKHMKDELGWELHRIDATCVVENSGEDTAQAWRKLALEPSLAIVNAFLQA